jgi:hypothetical protein
MYIHNRTLLVVIGFCLATALLAYAFDSVTTAGFFLEGSLMAAEWLAVALLLQNGTFGKTAFFKISLFAAGLFVIGSLFRVMHWPGAKELLVSSVAFILGTYEFHFAKKSSKHRLDWLKLLWVLTRVAGTVLTVLHQPYGREVLYLSHAVLTLALLDFVYIGNKNNTLFSKP